MNKILNTLKDFCIFYTIYRGMEHFANVVRGLFGQPLLPIAEETAPIFFGVIFGLVLFTYIYEKYFSKNGVY